MWKRSLGEAEGLPPTSLEEKCSTMLASLTSQTYFRTRERTAAHNRIANVLPSTQTGFDGSSWQSLRQKVRPSGTIYGIFM